MPAIHENLKALRRERGMTQEQVAARIAVTRQTVSSYESGRTQPDLETLKRLAAVYETGIEEILYGGGKARQRLKWLRRTGLAAAAALLLGLLVHAALLWGMNRFFPARSGMTDSGIIEARFALLDAAQVAVQAGSGLFHLGCLALLCQYIPLERTPHRLMRLFWLLGLTAAAFLLPLPWALGDGIYHYADYILPLARTLPAAVLTFLLTLGMDFLKKRLPSAKSS